MGAIFNVAKRLADEGNSLEVILAAIKSMEDGAAPPRKGRDGSPRCELERVLGGELAQAVLDHRQRIRRPLTAYAAKQLAEEFGATNNPEAAAKLMISMGWQGFRREWYDKEQSRGGYQARPVNSVVEDRRRALAERVGYGDDLGIGRDRGDGAAPVGQLPFAGADARYGR